MSKAVKRATGAALLLAVMAAIGVATPASATLGVNDYPYQNQAFDSGLSPLRFYYKNCTDFVAWRLNQARGGSATNLKFTWASLPFPRSTAYPNGDGNARGWMSAATAAGYAVDTKPAPGAVAWRGPIPYSPTGPIGHVAIVDRVYANGTMDYEDYNADSRGSYALHLGAPISSFDRYLHIADVAPTSSSTQFATQYTVGTTDGALWHTVRGTDGNWSSRGNLKSQLGLAAATTAVAATHEKNGNDQYIIATADGGLWHTARFADGSWQPKANLRATLGLTTATAAVTAVADGSGAVQFLIATSDGTLWHTIRFANGAWQAKGNLTTKFGLARASAVTSVSDGTGAAEFAIATSDGGLWHTARFGDGTWMSRGDLRAKLGLPLGTVTLAAARGLGGSEYVIGTSDGGLWHTIRATDGSWQAKGDLRAKFGFTAATRSLGAVADGGGAVQFVIATSDGGLWHTIRSSNGSWQAKGDLRGQLGLSGVANAVSAG